MSHIHRLPPELANQIAAGEVVERPASVVKELVENAIDAGASRVTITTEFGGKKLIRVEDDGAGMDGEDAQLAFERHATSKIRRKEDLEAIHTLGFRGEALPSIASVSHLRLLTRARGASGGTEIRVNGGVIESVREAGAPEGTLIEVADLFYNLPARRKFLKSDAAEAAQMSRLVTQLAVGYPTVGFTLSTGGRAVVQCPPAASLEERFFQLHGERADLVTLRKEMAGLKLFGYVAALTDQGPVRGAQNVFVNGRIVKDRTIAHAIIEAYSTASIKERSPEVHLFLDLPPDRVDVNVHPTKAEVRFLDQSFIHQALRHALSDALGQGTPPQLQLRTPVETDAGGVERALPGLLGGSTYTTTRWMPSGRIDGFDPASLQLPPASGGAGSSTAPPAGDDEDALRPMMPLGQFRETFIIAVDDEGIAIIDQHVAHERVLFEQAMERLSAGRLESQRLLTPIVLDLAAGQRQALVAHTPDLERFGFEVEPFGGGAVCVTSVPALLGTEASAAAVRALAEDLEGLDRGSRVEDALRRIAATTACHAAVKANYPLTFEKMRHILDELRRTAYSSICPHGRPVVLRLTRREIEKNFQRI